MKSATAKCKSVFPLALQTPIRPLPRLICNLKYDKPNPDPEVETLFPPEKSTRETRLRINVLPACEDTIDLLRSLRHVQQENSSMVF